MSALTERRLPLPSLWQVEFARLIAFPVNSPLFIDQQWWQELTREQPEDLVSTREAQFRDDRGSFRGVLLSLTVNANLIVWEARSPRKVDQSGHFSTFGLFREKLAWFVELLSPWLLNSCPPLVRLALSAKLLQTAATVEEAYQILSGHLPAAKRILDSNPNDFVLQINRRTESSTAVSRLPINRVCTWSKMNLPIQSEPGRSFQWPVQCYSALELDINTAPENTDVLPRASLPLLLIELLSLGSDIAEHGDNP